MLFFSIRHLTTIVKVLCFEYQAHPEWLQVNVWNGSVGMNSGSTMYGRIYAPNHTVSLNAGSVLTGAVSAKTLNLNSSGTVFSLSPPESKGY